MHKTEACHTIGPTINFAPRVNPALWEARHLAEIIDNMTIIAGLAPPLSSRRLTLSDQDLITAMELTALKTALTVGHILHRALILPQFHIGPFSRERPLNSPLDIAAFDEQFAGQYRENSFLRHLKVPPSVKSSRAKPRTLHGNVRPVLNSVPMAALKRLRKVFFTGDWLRKAFEHANESVLIIDGLSLYLAHVRLLPAADNTDKMTFREKLELGFVRASYRQFQFSSKRAV